MATAKELELLEKELTVLRDINKEIAKAVSLSSTEYANRRNELNIESSLIRAMKTSGKMDKERASIEIAILRSKSKMLDFNLLSNVQQEELKRKYKIQLDLLEKHKKAASSMAGMWDGIDKKLGGIGAKSKKLVEQFKLAPGLFLAGIAIDILKYSLLKIWNIFDQLDSAAADFRKSMGIVRSQSVDMEKVIRDIAVHFMGIGVSGKDVAESLKAISETAGSTQSYTREMVVDMATFSAQFGITAQTSAKFLKTMAAVSQSTMSTQTDMLMLAQHMAAAAGVPLDAVMQDVASASEKGYQFLSRDPLVLLKATIQARLLGTSLQSSTATAGSLLRFTESVKNEMEASVLLGKSLNLQKARELAYNRDIEGLNKEIVKLAKEANFEQLDPFQQDAVARALGKEAGEVAAMLESDREHLRVMNAMSAVDKKRYNDIMNVNKSQIKDYAEMARKEVQRVSNQKAILAITQAWNAIFAKMGEQIFPIIASILVGIAKILNSGAGTWIMWIVGVTSVLVGVGLLFFALYKTFKILAVIKTLFGAIAKSAAPGAGGGLGGMIKNLGDAIGKFPVSAIKKLAAGIVMIAALGAAIWVLAWGFSKFADVKWSDVFIGLGALAAFAVVAGVMGIGPIAAAIGIGILLIAGLGVALMIFAVAAMLGAKAMDMLGKALPGLADGLSSLSKVGWKDLLKLGAITVALAAMGALAIPLMMFASAISILAVALSPFVVGLKMLETLKFSNAITQLTDLSKAVVELNKAINEKPEIKIGDRLNNLTLPTAGAGATVENKGGSSSDILISIKDGIEGLRNDMKNGLLSANVYLDSQKLDSGMTRRLKYTGALTT